MGTDGHPISVGILQNLLGNTMTLISDPKETAYLYLLLFFVLTGIVFWIYQFYILLSPVILNPCGCVP